LSSPRQRDVLFQQAFSDKADECLLIFESFRTAATAVVHTAPPGWRRFTFQPKVNEEAHLVLLQTRSFAHFDFRAPIVSNQTVI